MNININSWHVIIRNSINKMKSKAHFKSHPVHPILIVFPIAFFIGAVLFDVLGQVFSKESFTTTALYLVVAGITGGLIAAIPGFIDYVYTIPPRSSAKKRATLHMIVNITMIAIFAFALYLRTNTFSSPWSVIIIELTGIIFLTIGGWLGGTLVYRNQIGVDVRYAHAGKWKQATFEDNKDRFQIATSDELKENQMKLVIVGDTRIALARTKEKYVAFNDRCPHRGGALTGGSMMCETVQCPWHGSQFDVTTGDVKAGPAKTKIETYQVVEDNGKVWLISPTSGSRRE